MIEAGQVWRHKRQNKTYVIEEFSEKRIVLRETVLTSTSPPEGTLRVMKGDWRDYFLATHEREK